MKKVLALFLALNMLISLAAWTNGGSTVICGNCAARVSESSQYCSGCGAQLFQNLEQGGHIADLGQVFNTANALNEKRCGQYCHGRVFRATNRDRTG